MTADMFYQLKDKNDDILLAPTNFAVLGGHYGVEIPASLTGSDGYLVEMPEGWKSYGEIQKAAGVNLAPSMSVTGPEGYGSRGRRRDLIESEDFNVEFTAQEPRLHVLDQAMDIDTNAPVRSSDGNDIRFRKRRTRRLPEYSLALIALDTFDDREIYPYWIFPKMTNTNRAPIGLNETNIMEFAIQMSMKEDPAHDPFYFGLAGPGAAEYVQALGLELPTSGGGSGDGAGNGEEGDPEGLEGLDEEDPEI